MNKEEPMDYDGNGVNGHDAEEEQATKVISRDYQLELFEMAKKKNVIICLPTGSGKTWIALLLIKHYYGESMANKKKIVFLANQVQLVKQQFRYIKAYVPSDRIQYFTGDRNVDSWDSGAWQQELIKADVLVMSSEIFRKILLIEIQVCEVSLLILDECHHADKNHPMKQVMDIVNGYRGSSDSPRVMGLTACVVRSSKKGEGGIPMAMEKLERALHARAITSRRYDQVVLHSANAGIRTAVFPSFMVDGAWEEIVAKLTEDLDNFVSKPSDHPAIQRILTQHFVNPSKRFINRRTLVRQLANNIKIIQHLYSTLGAWCANVGLIIFMKEITKIKATTNFRPLERMAVQLYETGILDMQIVLTRVMRGKNRLYSPKVKVLLAELLKKRSDQNLRAIVFVERQLTCQALHLLAITLCKTDPERWGFLRTNFVVGARYDSTVHDKLSSHHLQEETLQGFRDNKFNILFSTSVLEEGLDVPSCNIIIRFDKIVSYQSFVQSMGRARSKVSAEFIIMVEKELAEIEKHVVFHYMFFGVAVIKALIKNADCLDVDVGRHVTTAEVTPFCPGGTPTSPRLTSYDAIETVYQYCAILSEYSRDMRGANFPVAWYDELLNPGEFILGTPRQYVAFLVLPKNAAVTEKIQGPRMLSKAGAKRGVFLEACKKLYEAGALSEKLRPIRTSELSEVLDMFERCSTHHTGLPANWYKTKVPHKFDVAAGAEASYFLYELEIELAKPHGKNAKERMFQYGDRKYSTGLLSTQSLDMIPAFKLESGLSTLNLRIVNTSKSFRLGPNQRQALATYQRNLFVYVVGLKNVLNLMTQRNDSPLWVVPIRKLHDVSYTIDYGIMAQLDEEYVDGKLNPKYDVRVPETERTLPEDSPEFRDKGGYKDAVVILWCGMEQMTTDRLHCVVDVPGLTEEATTSELDINCDITKTKKKFDEEKYQLKLTRKGQLLLNVRKIGKTVDFLKEREKLNKKDDMWLTPELVRAFSLPASLYVQAKMLPSIIHRIKRLLVAMELGRDITCDPNRDLKRPTYKVGDPWMYNEIVGERNYVRPPDGERTRHSTQANGGVLDSDLGPRFCLPRRTDGITELDFQKEQNRFLRRLKSSFPLPTTILLHLFRKMPESRLEAGSTSCSLKSSNSTADEEVLDKDTTAYPPIYELLEAITVAGALDRKYFSLERMEVIGDSFLKYSVTLAVYAMFTGCGEGKLTQIRSKVVCNKNLRLLGDVKGLGEMLAGGIFHPEYNCLPPSFVINESLAKAGMKNSLNLHAFNKMDFHTINGMTLDEMIAYEKGTGDCKKRSPKAILMGYTKLREKDIADCVEAVIGAYYLAGGEASALRVMEWFDIKCPDPTGNPVVIGQQVPQPWSYSAKDRRPEYYVPFLSSLEASLNYKFKNPWLLVEALTHPNDVSNRVTGSFERLEFLGDAVLDFLITRHIYNEFLARNPGGITDLRSALVNNLTFAALAVRNGFQKHLLQTSRELEGSIRYFVNLQEQTGHTVRQQFTSLVQFGVPTAVDVEVPKVLGDIFESICGAAFIDTGMDLEKTWETFYPLLKNEIESFTKKCPKAPVRQIEELGFTAEFGTAGNGITECTIYTPHGQFKGHGASRKSAKEAAAKLTVDTLPEQLFERKESKKTVVQSKLRL